MNEQRELAREIEQATGAKPAFIYVSFVPAQLGQSAQLGAEAQDDDQLELLVITAQGNPIRQRIPATRSQVLAVAQAFRSAVADPRQSENTNYLAPSQQMYRWIMAPIETELKARGINNLVFLMDTGLRSLPVAALHDGNQFLIERSEPAMKFDDTADTDIDRFFNAVIGA